MRKLVLFAFMVSSLSSCSLFSANTAAPRPGQAAEATQSNAQPCNNTADGCAKSVSPSFH